VADRVEKALERFRRFAEQIRSTAEGFDFVDGDDPADRAKRIMELDRAVRRFEGNAHHDRRAARNIHRKRFFDRCKGFGKHARDVVTAGQLADTAIAFFVADFPEYSRSLKAKRDTIAQLLHTYTKKVGGRGRRGSLGRDLLQAEICDAVGWSQSDAQRQAKSRAKKHAAKNKRALKKKRVTT